MVNHLAGSLSATLKNHAKENLLLASLPHETLERLISHMSIADFNLGEVLADCEESFNQVYFPLRNTLISLVLYSADGAGVEVGMVGREGLVEVTSFLGSTDVPYSIVVQGPGRAVKIDLKIMLSYFKKDEALRDIVLGYSRQLLICFAQTALCNRIHSLEERLARWLLMSHDRVQLKELPLTHELLSKMLGTDRGSVSVAAKNLQNRKLISYARGKVSIENPSALRKTSCDCYEILKRQKIDKV